jgi:hypothetical protein
MLRPTRTAFCLVSWTPFLGRVKGRRIERSCPSSPSPVGPSPMVSSARSCGALQSAIPPPVGEGLHREPAGWLRAEDDPNIIFHVTRSNTAGADVAAFQLVRLSGSLAAGEYGRRRGNICRWRHHYCPEEWRQYSGIRAVSSRIYIQLQLA